MAELGILRLTDVVVQYMQDRWRQHSDPAIVVAHPAEWTLEMAKDCDHAVTVIFEAWKNPMATGWDIERYRTKLAPAQTGQNLKQEELQESRFPPIFQKPYPVLDKPAVATDMHGNALVWYLPAILSPILQRSLWNNLPLLSGMLSVKQSSHNWRVGPKYYRPAIETTTKPGTVSMSPGWFEQGHEGKHHTLTTSVQFEDPGCILWMARTHWVAAIIGGVLSLIHPEQYLLGRAALLRLVDRPDKVKSPLCVSRALKDWTSPFTALSIVVNRITPIHRDSQGRDTWLDMLVTFGPYQDCRMEFRSLGFRVMYDTGTMVGVCSKVVPHAVSDCKGERACIAYYLRDNVLERLGIPAGGWMNIH